MSPGSNRLWFFTNFIAPSEVNYKLTTYPRNYNSIINPGDLFLSSILCSHKKPSKNSSNCSKLWGKKITMEINWSRTQMLCRLLSVFFSSVWSLFLFFSEYENNLQTSEKHINFLWILCKKRSWEINLRCLVIFKTTSAVCYTSKWFPVTWNP